MSAFLTPDWPAPACVRALTTLRTGPGMSLAPFDSFNLGDRCGDDPTAVASNRAALQGALALTSMPRWLRQVHGNTVRHVDAIEPPEPPEADAAITDQAGIALAILTADCLPVLLCARDGREVAAVHAGWRGLAAGVIEATIAAMRTAPDHLLAWIGPAAGPSAYEVGEDVRAGLAIDEASLRAFTPTRPGHWLCDLPLLARQRLNARGVNSVHGGQHCTISDQARFYSHRRDGRSGRMATLIWIESPPTASTC